MKIASQLMTEFVQNWTCND